MIRLPFLENTTPPPFYQPQLSDAQRRKYDRWFIGQESQAYYLKRFDEFDKAGRLYARWHWAAFFMTSGWLLYRKRYLDCLVYCVAGWSFIKVNIAIVLALFEFVFMDYVPTDWQWQARALVGGGVWLFWSSLVARWADAYYYRMARREIADVIQLKAGDEASQEQLQKEGGTGLLGLAMAMVLVAIIGSTLAAQFIPIIAIKQEQQLVFDSYRMAHAIQKRHLATQEQVMQCQPMTMTDTHPKMQVQIAKSLTDTQILCSVQITLEGIGYPVRYLNGSMLMMYQVQDKDGRYVWRCKSSLNQQRKWQKCIG